MSTAICTSTVMNLQLTFLVTTTATGYEYVILRVRLFVMTTVMLCGCADAFDWL